MVVCLLMEDFTAKPVARLRASSAVVNLMVPLLVAVLALIFWDSFVVYPLKILVVLFHELSHGLAALVSGGSIERIEITPEQGGVCVTLGGSRFLILNAGYLGSLAWGAVLLVIGARSRYDRPVVGALGALLLAVTVLYVRSWFGFAYGLAAGVVLLAVAARLPDLISDLLLTIVGTVSCLYAVWDIGSDILFRKVPGSDAHGLAELTGLPSMIWGLLWVVLALLITGAALLGASQRTPTSAVGGRHEF